MPHPAEKIAFILGLVALPTVASETQINIASFRDRLEGGWVGQMAGVAWGYPTEGAYVGRPLADANVPVWQPHLINSAFDQDDIYVEIPFMQTMRRYGVNANWTQFGSAFRVTEFPLWVANGQARDNLNAGIPAPFSGHPTNNQFFESIDWQIESNFAGLVAPGMVRAASDIAFRGGHVMNYADGVYGGVAFAAMTARAYTATSLDEVIETGRQSVPVGTQYRQLIDDVIAWHAADPDKTTWLDTWEKIEQKWSEGFYWTAARSNGAYVFMGLLYGDGDFEESMRISMQGGRDSDCNPSSVGGILGAMQGLSALPETWKSELDRSRKWSYTDLTYDETIELSVDLARQVVRQRGGTVAGAGEAETWMIPDDGGTLAPIRETWPWTDYTSPSVEAEVVSVDGMTVTLSVSATDSEGIGGYQWFFGDLSYSEVLPTAGTISHTYHLPGTYDILAYATDTLGRTHWKSLMATVLPDGAVLGDTDFDGRITADDYARIDIGFLGRRTGYSNGDFNSDGIIDVDDYAMIDAAYLAQASGAVGSGIVPEPGGIAIGGAALIWMTLRRRWMSGG